jgi:hypothetical protein
MISPTHDTHHPRRYNRVTDTPSRLTPVRARGRAESSRPVPDAIPAGWGAPVLAFVLGVCLTVVCIVGITLQGVHSPAPPTAASTPTP